MQEQKNVQVSEQQVSLEAIRAIVKGHKSIVEQQAATGFSYFAGKKRLCKLLKTKKGVTLEINVPLSKKYSELQEMQSISLAVAKAKHLGTMKHLYRAPTAAMIKDIMVDALKIFEAEIKALEEPTTPAAKVKEA
jgi:hypothetical protein